MNNIPCVICHKNIKLDKDTYFKVERYDKGKFFGRDFAHVQCWHQGNALQSNINRLVSDVTDFAVKNGIVKEQVIKI